MREAIALHCYLLASLLVSLAASSEVAQSRTCPLTPHYRLVMGAAHDKPYTLILLYVFALRIPFFDLLDCGISVLFWNWSCVQVQIPQASLCPYDTPCWNGCGKLMCLFVLPSMHANVDLVNDGNQAVKA